ncbi:MAG: YfiR family protein [Pontibacterium sp.]
MLLLVCNVSVAGAHTAPIDETLKSALVYKLAKFVQWPESSYMDDKGFYLCLLNDGVVPDSFKVLESHTLQAMPITVNAFRRSDMVNNHCDVVLIDSAKAPFLQDILTTLGSKGPMLTVSDYKGFAAQGGMVELGLVHGKVKFHINRERAIMAKLKISSTLLQLATLIRTKEGR